MKTTRSFIGFVIALILITSSMGQEPATNPTTAAAREEARQRRAKLPFAKGTLLLNDVLRRSFNLQTENGTRTFTYTDRTYIFRGKERITPDKLMIGETIALRFYADDEGRSVVQRIKAYGVRPTTVEPPGPS